jgi:hypothetical protein
VTFPFGLRRTASDMRLEAVGEPAMIAQSCSRGFDRRVRYHPMLALPHNYTIGSEERRVSPQPRRRRGLRRRREHSDGR